MSQYKYNDAWNKRYIEESTSIDSSQYKKTLKGTLCYNLVAFDEANMNV